MGCGGARANGDPAQARGRGATRDAEYLVRHDLIFVSSSNPQLTVFSLASYMARASERDKAVRIFKEQTAANFREIRSQFCDADTRMRKTMLSLQVRVLAQTERTVSYNDVAERYEAIARSFQGMVFGFLFSLD